MSTAGLAYTEFAYSDLEVTPGTGDEVATIAVTGKGFRQVDLAPGELTVVQLELPVAACSIVDAEGVRVVEPGEFDLRVGRSSRAADQLVATFWVE